MTSTTTLRQAVPVNSTPESSPQRSTFDEVRALRAQSQPQSSNNSTPSRNSGGKSIPTPDYTKSFTSKGRGINTKKPQKIGAASPHVAPVGAFYQRPPEPKASSGPQL